MSRRAIGRMASLPALSRITEHSVARNMLFQAAVRSVWILKPQKMRPFRKPDQPPQRLSAEHSFMVYDEVACTHKDPLPPLDMLLLANIAGMGKAGQIVSVDRDYARWTLLPEGKATYVTPQALARIEAAKKARPDDPTLQASSRNSEKTQLFLNNLVCNIFMNHHSPWTLEKWNIRAALRQNHVWVPDEAIEMPEQEIAGPDRSQHGKCFSVHVKINKKERASVLCRVLLFSREPSDSLPEIDLSSGKPENPEPLYPGAIAPDNMPPLEAAPKPPGTKPKPGHILKPLTSQKAVVD